MVPRAYAKSEPTSTSQALKPLIRFYVQEQMLL